MNFIRALKKEHEQIERELIELETIIDSKEINYPNLIHVYKRLHDFWNAHEKKEEEIFKILKHEKIIMPVKKIFFEHGELTPHKKALLDAINSGSEEKIKEVLDGSGRVILGKLRTHINFEDEILYRITLEQFTDEEITKAEKMMDGALSIE